MPRGQKSLSNVHLGFGAVTRTRNDRVHASSLDIRSISNTSTCSLLMNSRRRSSSMDESTLKTKSSSRRGALLIVLDMHPLAAASRSRLLCSKRPIMRSALNVSLRKT